ncbi:sterol desaturase family protein [Roseateles violae]|uniref:Sterol desaturase family protein n=1 Tax=Roseateles violae TaxID=3058042 RepID=A0ABT8DQV7_9BURK|nr:sterol desaturase family protein [Pelomonas sp. PFR6]MDN3918677.1 sterol desaturase family protein [Pelomonas sp. PFR6]
MQAAQIIVLVTPLFFLMIAVEFWVGWRRGRNTYRLNDALNSIGLGMLSQLVGLLTKLLTLGIYVWVYERAALFELSAQSPWVWLSGLLLYDLLYYWYHRLGHTTALLWAAHAVHHQSEDYNLSTALRQTSSGWLLGWLFYLPMAVLGFPPLVFAVVGLVDLLYQFWVHTQQVGRLGWFDRWFCSPSNHRVHHAVNDPYLDRNYGGILIIWDRIFGSFQDELDTEPCVYGTRDALHSWNPLRANWQVYGALLRKARWARGWREWLQICWEPAHWQPAAAPQAPAQAAYDPHTRPLYDPAVPALRQGLALALFGLLLAATTGVLWFSHLLGPWQQAGALLLIAAGLVGVGRLCSPGAARPLRSPAEGTVASS